MKMIFLFILIAWLVMAQSCMKFRISDSKAKQAFSAAGQELFAGIFTVNTYELHYAKTGSDTLPTLFFVHGSPGAWNAFEAYMKDEALRARYRMVAVDRPGFGYSRFGDAKNLDEQSVIIGPFVKSLYNTRPIYAVGHSLGGPVIAKLQMDNPRLFAGLVFLAASVDPAEEKKERWRYFFDVFPFTYFLPGAFRPSNTELIYLKKDLRVMDTLWGNITCPIWIVHGDRDSFVPVGNAAYAEKKMVNAAVKEVKILKGARHFIPWEQYDDVKKVLLEIY